MTLQVLMENHTDEDHTIVCTAKGIAARTADHIVGCTAEVAVQDPSVCVGSARNAKSRMNLRTTYPTDREYQQTT
jgi:hypothetical protein